MQGLVRRVLDAVTGLRCGHDRGAVFAFACPWCERDAMDRRVVLTAGFGTADDVRRALDPEWREQVLP